MRRERTKFLKKTYEKDREYFREHEDSLRSCTKVWDIPMTYSSTHVTEGDQVVHELKAAEYKYEHEESMTPEQRMEAAKQEYLRFSNFDEDGNFVGNDIRNIDAHNTNRVFTKQKVFTRHKFRPYDK